MFQKLKINATIYDELNTKIWNKDSIQQDRD